MPANFPINPTLNQTYTFSGSTWTWDGSTWLLTSTAQVTGATGATGAGVTLTAVASHIIPAANVTYDLGTGSQRWRDLYLSGNTIDLGGTAIKSSANGVSFTSAANAAATVPLTVSSIQLSSGGNVITLQASASGLQTVGSSGNAVPISGGGKFTYSNAAPSSPTAGDRWLDTETLKEFVFADLGATGIWIEPAGDGGFVGATGPAGTDATVATANTAPVLPTNGKLWFDTDAGDLYVYFANSWVMIGSGGSGGAGGVTAVYDVASTSTGYFDLPSGNTAQRPASPSTGAIRYNSTTGFAEVYTAVGWGSFGAQPPSISTVNPVTYNGESGTQFTINGANFTNDVTVYFVTNGGAEYMASIVSYVNASQIIATTPRDFSISDEPLDVKLVQTSGVVTKLDAIDCGGSPNWTTAAGNIGTIQDLYRVFSYTLVAADPDAGGTVTYAVTSGSLPTGLSLAANSGVISGTAGAVASDTTYNFTVTATDNAGNTSSRNFNIVVNAPTTVVYSYTGADQTFTVPTWVSRVTFKLWGAGGSGRNLSGGSGGFTQATIATSGGTVYTVMVGQASFARDGGTNYGGGRRGYLDAGYGAGDGGGRSAIIINGADIITAGGGGGGGYGSGGGGNGGGLVGASAGGPYGGTGGTQTAGGTGVCGNSCGGNGSQYLGGTTGTGFAGGGGGGGWYGGAGGGGGSDNHNGGGGGSGWVGRNGSTTLSGNEYGSAGSLQDAAGRLDTVSNVTYFNTTTIRGNNSSDPNWGSSAGAGGVGTASNGRVVVIY